MSIAIISFSSRPDGNCARIGRYLQSLTGGTLYSFAALHAHPCGGCRYECFDRPPSCPYQDDGLYILYDAIVASDVTYFVLPNYCDYPCANFFLFYERCQGYFLGRAELSERYDRIRKKAVVISNTQEQNFRAVLAQQSSEEVKTLFLHAKDYGRISLRGDLMQEPAVRAQLDAFIMA